MGSVAIDVRMAKNWAATYEGRNEKKKKKNGFVLKRCEPDPTGLAFRRVFCVLPCSHRSRLSHTKRLSFTQQIAMSVFLQATWCLVEVVVIVVVAVGRPEDKENSLRAHNHIVGHLPAAAFDARRETIFRN